jgi:UDP-2-acetamido-3-amino-2,3-dideoxy-glucuronate N-acetyltransferase
MTAVPRKNIARVAVMGTGRWGRNVVRVLDSLENARVAWIVDPDPNARNRAAALAPGAKTAAHISAAIEDVDLVAVCTPARDHAAHVLHLLDNTKSVLVEKPFAMNSRDALSLARACRPESTLMVGHQLLFHPAFRKLSELVAGGALGPLRKIRTERNGPIDLSREPGVLWSYGPHDVAMALDLAGEEPTRINASSPATAGDVESAGQVEVELDFQSGVKAEINLSSARDDSKRRLLAVCEQGTLVFDDTHAGGRLFLFDAPPGCIANEEISVERREPLALECAHFVDCSRDGETPRTGLRHALSVTRVLDRAAARIGAAVPEASSFSARAH